MKKRKLFVIAIASLLSLGAYSMFGFFKKSADDKSIGLISPHLKEIDPSKVNWKDKSDEYWKKVLSPIQYDVTRNQGTERAFTGQFWDFKKEGIYTCSNCGQHLFHSSTKFKSGTGWPSFYTPVKKENVGEHVDKKFGMTRTEVHCSRCNAHLGHVFPDGPKPTGLRYCINSVSLNHVVAK